MNNSLSEIAEILLGSEKAVLYPHENMDGDALGSCVALALALRQKGKNALILIDEKITSDLAFMNCGLITRDFDEAKDADLSVLVDAGDIERIGTRGEVFLTGKESLCIDHHRTSAPFCRYNLIDPDAAAAGLLVFDVIKALGAEGTPEMGNALFAAITTDTGKFQYSNTDKRTHLVTAELYDWGMDHLFVSNEIYENNRPERMRIESMAILAASFYAGGRLAMTFVTREMLKASGADMSETDVIIPKLRSIRGVEVAAVLKEEEPEKIKVSLRSKNSFDVSSVAQAEGGGGHSRAAGFTLRMTMDEAFDKTKNAILSRLEAN